MKKLLFISLFLLSCNIVFAQVKKGDYIKDLNLQKFVGTWQSTAGHNTFTIVFEKRKVYFEAPDVYVDAILGWHKYAKDGAVTENYLDEVGTSFNNSTLKGNTLKGNTEDNASNKLELIFSNPEGDYLYDATFKITSGKPNRGILKLRFSDSSNTDRDATAIPIPSTWHMKRIK